MKHLLKLVFITFYFELIDSAPQPQSTYGAGEPQFSELGGSQQMIGAQNPVYVYGVPIYATKDQGDDVAVLIKARSGFPLDPSGAPIQLIPPMPNQIPMEGAANSNTTLQPLQNYGNGEIAAAATAVSGDTSPTTAAADTAASPAAETQAPAAETTAAAAADTTAAAVEATTAAA